MKKKIDWRSLDIERILKDKRPDSQHNSQGRHLKRCVGDVDQMRSDILILFGNILSIVHTQSRRTFNRSPRRKKNLGTE